MKFLHCFLVFWVIFALLNPDPAFRNKYGSGSSALKSSSIFCIKTVAVALFPKQGKISCTPAQEIALLDETTVVALAAAAAARLSPGTQPKSVSTPA
jgi:hypothetical protein